MAFSATEVLKGTPDSMESMSCEAGRVCGGVVMGQVLWLFWRKDGRVGKYACEKHKSRLLFRMLLRTGIMHMVWRKVLWARKRELESGIVLN